MYLRLVQAYHRRRPDDLTALIVGIVCDAWLKPFGSTEQRPRRERERMKAALREVWRQTASWRIREPRCGVCGEVGPERGCGNPCLEGIPF